MLMFTKCSNMILRRIHQLFCICNHVGASDTPITVVACPDPNHGGKVSMGFYVVTRVVV